LHKVSERIHQEYDAVYGHEKIAQLGKEVKLAKPLATFNQSPHRSETEVLKARASPRKANPPFTN